MNREKFKQVLLLGLIATSIIQVGILWDFSAHGIPSYFFRAFQERVVLNSTSAKKMKTDLFTPKRIIVSTGASNCIVTKEGDTQDTYKDLWADAQIYIRKIITGDEIDSVELPDEQWAEIVLRKSIAIEFETPLSLDMIGYFLDSKVKSNSEISIVKIVISPWDSLNSYNSNTVYLLDSNNHVYKYNIALSQNNLKAEAYDEFIVKLTMLQNQGAVKNYTVFSESKIKLDFPIRQDMLVSASGNKYEKYGQINVSIPDNFRIAPGAKLQEVENKLGGILGRDSDSYDIFTDTKGTVTMKNLNNQYRVYTNGILEYKKIGNLAGEKGSKGQALKNAMLFVEGLGLLPDNVQVYISGVEYLKDRYRFTLDYKIENIPIYFDVGVSEKSGEKIKNVIVIESNNDGAISCNWLVRDIELLKDKKNQYNVNSFDIFDNIFLQYPNLKQQKDFSIQDVVVGYRVTETGYSTRLDPMGMVMGGNNSIYSVKLAVKKGD